MMPMFMLDANMASYAMRDTHPQVRLHMMAHDMRDLCLSSIAFAELLYGARSGSPEILRKVEELAAAMTVVPWNAAETHAELRIACRKNGTPLSTLDLLIAAQARSIGATLVTAGQAFYNVRPVLDLVDWTKPV